ncbi:IucA/IucC family siderophore biosynthesis protein [Plantactinospora sp. S1510]|uniref:IucA/IucC family siderophore biosynthesis protein n=1 Tax=Plantactinospora alkalitolerans TaxID=2789879 RepID=A0ABS0GYW4_9ACTN|nr:IucA/IucC family protein [Plantactinospora alkalitolerans]MBF9131370.1 IucA/IucC family siderophore biosynthesis protein [Plantactinospora alkalitolerans]
MSGSTGAERELFQRVLDALLREDHLGLASNGRPGGDGWWLTRTGTARLRLPVRPDGFQHDLRSARPEFVVEDGTGPERLVRTLDGLLDVLGPTDDPEAEAGWLAFRAECRHDLAARRLAAQTRPRVYAELRAARRNAVPAGSAAQHAPTGMAGALLDDVLAARTDHPVYPTSRCRHGLGDTDLLGYAPEHAPRFALRWLPVPRSEVTLTGALPPWWPPAGTPGTVLLPVHPVTADRLSLPILPVREDGPEILVRPTLSTRTVSLVDDPYTHLKLPLATATLGARNIRTIAPDTLVDGAELHRLLAGIAAAEPAFAGRILHADESCYGHAGDDVRSFLLRRYPSGLAGHQVVPVAGLAAEDPDAGSVAQRVGGPDPVPLLDAYLDLLIDWHGYLWLRHGIALEAHQQNIHLVLDPVGGGELRLLYKDNDGARLARRSGPELRDARMWITDPAELADVFTTITLHLAAAAPLRALAERGVPVPAPGTALRTRLVATRDRWAAGPPGPDGWNVAAAADLLTERVLTASRLPVKAMVTAGTLLPKQRTGCADINKYYLRTGPNYLRSDR